MYAASILHVSVTEILRLHEFAMGHRNPIIVSPKCKGEGSVAKLPMLVWYLETNREEPVGAVSWATFRGRNNHPVRALVFTLFTQLEYLEDDGRARAFARSFDLLALGTTICSDSEPTNSARVARQERF